MTEIFDAERARRLAILRQSTAPNVIKINPDTASFLRRYEDADVSRLKLLEAQRLRQEGEAEKQLIKSQQKRLKKRLRGKGKGLPKGRGSRGGRAAPPQKSALEVEIEREKQLEDIRKQKKKEEVEEERFAAERVDARLERRRLERSTRQEARLADDRLFFEGFQRAQDRGQLLEIEDRRELLAIADRRASRQRLEQELGVRRGELAAGRAERAEREQIRDRERQERLEDRQEQARLQDQREEIQGRQIAAAQESNREIQAQQLRLIEEDRGRYDREVRSLQTQREQDIARIEAERAGVAERVARDDAFRHAQLQEQQKLALENLAKQQRDNTALHELEQNRIDNQRAVDAERAITDRELIQGFTSAIQTLNTQRDQDPPRVGPSAEELATTVREALRTGVGAGPQPQPEPARTETTSSETPESDLGTEEEEVVQIQDVPGDVTPRQTVAERRSPSPRRSPAQGAPSERQPLTLEEQSGSSVSSSEEGLDPDTQRSLSIMSGRRQPQQEIATPTVEPLDYDRFFAPRPEASPEARGQVESVSEDTPSTPAEEAAIERAYRDPVETVAEDSTLQQVGGAIGGAVTGLARGAGGLVAGVGQGVYEQLPAASDVGAAVGRAGVGAVAGLGGAIYEGIAGGEQTDEPIDRQGTSAGD